MSSPPKPPKGHFNLLYFAGATSFTGKDYEVLPAPLRLAELFSVLEERYSGIREGVLEASMVTINLEYVDVPTTTGVDGKTANTDEADVVIQEGDEVAIIPPVSSG